MDEIRFDQAARLLARFAGRREVTGAVLGLAAGRLAPVAVATARKSTRKRCIHTDRRCGKKSGKKGGACKRCCSKFSLATSEALIPTGARRCSCRHDGMACSSDAQCCEGVCNPATNVCDDGLPGDPPAVCVTSVPFCQQAEQNCGSTTKCSCVTTSQGEMLCTNGNFQCVPIYANVTCNDDNDCSNDFGDGWACVSTSSCPSSVPCSGSGGTVCMEICGL